MFVAIRTNNDNRVAALRVMMGNNNGNGRQKNSHLCRLDIVRVGQRRRARRMMGPRPVQSLLAKPQFTPIFTAEKKQ
ncbi:hypothetical protein [Massilia sp. Root335]|uniref:hypothetical protein n=1 Tax=Massilia sp. Root335 TaxID=1736517 RepID=UPI0012F6C0A4|nr:hypothetical protein [Massilia sp. Root335]